MVLSLAALLAIVAIIYRWEHRGYRRNQAQADVLRQTARRIGL